MDQYETNGLVETHAEGAYNNVMYGTKMSDCFKYSVHDKSVDGSFSHFNLCVTLASATANA